MPASPSGLAFALVAMEGPDQYSQAGGLGVRVTQLGRALAARGCPTRLYFLGDPGLPEKEERDGLDLVRVGQEISRQYPLGVYRGEALKVSYLEARLPETIVEGWVEPALEGSLLPVLLFEEWQTAGWAIRVAELLQERGLEGRCLLVWNANNQFGFERMDWVGLERCAAITTISRHMRLLVAGFGGDPIVIPNGVPEHYLAPVGPVDVARLREAAAPRQVLFKVGRFHRDKRWLQAVRAVGQLRAEGAPVRLLIRGSSDHYRDEVLAAARGAGLRVEEWRESVGSAADLARALGETPQADLLELTRFLPEGLLPTIYASSLAVLANSGFEPFGLVGLEAMAAAGVAVVGTTGEDYSRHLHNSLAIETDSPHELADAIRRLVTDPTLADRIREAGRAMAMTYSWPRVVEGELLPRLTLLAGMRGVPWPQAEPSGQGMRASSRAW